MSTDPVTEATKPVTEQTKPVTEPTEPVTRPTRPVTEPTKPITEPTKPVTEMTKPPTPGKYQYLLYSTMDCINPMNAIIINDSISDFPLTCKRKIGFTRIKIKAGFKMSGL